MPLTENFTRGLVGIDDRLANIHPEAWDREVIKQKMRVAPIHTFGSRGGRKKTESRKWNWFEHPDADGQGTVTDVYTDSGLSSTYESGGIDGTTLYLKMSAADAAQIVKWDSLQVVDTVNSAFRNCIVLGVNIDGANSYVSVRLRETDTGNALANSALQFFLVGGGNSEGGALRDPLFSEPIQFSNCAERFDESWELTNDEMKELRRINEDAWRAARIQAYDRLMMKVERAFIFQQYADTIYGANGKLMLKTRGFKNAIETYESQNVFDFSLDTHEEILTDFSGDAWDTSAIVWFERVVEILRRKAKADMLTMFTSGWAILRFNQAIRNLPGHSYEFSRRPNSIGLNVMRLDTPAGSMNFVEHPDFSRLSFLRKCGLIVEKGHFTVREYEPIREIDARDLDAKEWTDSKKGGLMYKCGLKWDNLIAQGWVNNIGVDNAA